MTRNIAIVVVLLAALAAVWALTGPFSAGAPVEVARARIDSIREFVDEQGQTRLPKTHLITMPYNGRVESIDLAEGTSVAPGQVVARVAPVDLELDVDVAQATVDRAIAALKENNDVTVELTALEQTLNFVASMESTVKAAEHRVESGQAKLDFANKDMKRIRTLRETNAVTEEALNRAELAQVEARVDYQQDLLVLSALKSMQAATMLSPTLVRQYIQRKQLTGAVLEKEKTQADTSFRQADKNAKRGVMTSPVDGVVLERFETNERQVSAGTVLLSIGRLDELEVEVDVLSQDVVNVKPGDEADVYGPAIGARPTTATVSRVFPAGFTKISSLGVEQQRVKVVLKFDPKELARLRKQRDLGVGYRVRARIFTEEKSKALVIPRSSLFRGPAGDWQVFAVRDGVARLETIVVGLLNDDLAEVASGLAENDLVILAPETNLTQGTRVTPVLPAEQQQAKKAP